MTVEQTVVSFKDRLSRVKGQRDEVVRRLNSVSSEVQRLEEEDVILDLCTSMIRTLIDREVTFGVQAVEELLTEGLQVVFNDQIIKVKSSVDVHRGKVSVDFITVQEQADGTITEGISRESFGGAVTTVQSVLLRLIVITKRGLRPVAFLDETLPAFDSVYVYNMGTLLKTLCVRLGIDILLVSHNPAMLESADRAYQVVKTDGKATFKKIH